jgi:glycogen(starch) synthase
MRVLFWSPGFFPEIGGIEVFAGELLPAMQQRGYEYIVITWRNDPSLPAHARYKDIPIHRFSFWHSLVNIEQLMEVKREVARLKRVFAPDLIHVNGIGPDNFLHFTTANVHPAPLLVTLHNEWKMEAGPMVERTLRSAGWITGCSRAILDKAQRMVPEIISRSSLIYNAAAAASILPQSPPQAQRVLCLGRLAKEKGFDLALAAFALVVKEFPHATLVIAGDGPERAALTRHAAELGLAKTVDFIGWVLPDDVPELINTASVLVLPSRLEGLPLVALQAAQMARPVVATSVGGLPEVVLHQETGLLVEPENSSALAQAIQYCLRNPAAAKQMGQTAWLQAQRSFSWQRHIDAYDVLYQRLAGNTV